MKIFDCFMFNDENLLLEVRINELKNYVDYFIIVECKYNHQGKIKGQKIKSSILKKYKNQIRYFYITKKLKFTNSWELENWNRNQLHKGLFDVKKNDIIILSDLDEIPDLKKIKFNKISKEILAFKQIHTVYKFNLARSYSWYGTKLCRFSTIKSLQWLRQLKVHKKYSILRIDKLFSNSYYKNFRF